MQVGYLCVKTGRTGGERLDVGRASLCVGGGGGAGGERLDAGRASMCVGGRGGGGGLEGRDLMQEGHLCV